MVRLAGGCFEMGAEDGESNEKPRHEVCVQGFLIDRTEVTQEAWGKAHMGNPSGFKCEKCPVERVTWFEADQHCREKGLRLPTEAEWEYAARAGTSTPYPSGPFLDGEHAWYDGNAEGKTHPAASLRPNAWGLYDMLGNVWEWVADGWDSTYYAKSPRQDPKGPAETVERMARGGSWYNFEGLVRSSSRIHYLPAQRFVNVGFRCARDLVPPDTARKHAP
jgi:formylglycine-generating enzyme required for sulfatase activity